jgi:hypothetical protein
MDSDISDNTKKVVCSSGIYTGKTKMKNIVSPVVERSNISFEHYESGRTSIVADAYNLVKKSTKPNKSIKEYVASPYNNPDYLIKKSYKTKSGRQVYVAEHCTDGKLYRFTQCVKDKFESDANSFYTIRQISLSSKCKNKNDRSNRFNPSPKKRQYYDPFAIDSVLGTVLEGAEYKSKFNQHVCFTHKLETGQYFKFTQSKRDLSKPVKEARYLKHELRGVCLDVAINQINKCRYVLPAYPNSKKQLKWIPISSATKKHDEICKMTSSINNGIPTDYNYFFRLDNQVVIDIDSLSKRMRQEWSMLCKYIDLPPAEIIRTPGSDEHTPGVHLQYVLKYDDILLCTGVNDNGHCVLPFNLGEMFWGCNQAIMCEGSKTKNGEYIAINTKNKKNYKNELSEEFLSLLPCDGSCDCDDIPVTSDKFPQLPYKTFVILMLLSRHNQRLSQLKDRYDYNAISESEYNDAFDYFMKSVILPELSKILQRYEIAIQSQTVDKRIAVATTKNYRFNTAIVPEIEGAVNISDNVLRRSVMTRETAVAITQATQAADKRQNKTNRIKLNIASGGSKHTETLRYIGSIMNSSNKLRDYSEILEQALEYNSQFDSPLPDKKIEEMVKSIYNKEINKRYGDKNYTTTAKKKSEELLLTSWENIEKEINEMVIDDKPIRHKKESKNHYLGRILQYNKDRTQPLNDKRRKIINKHVAKMLVAITHENCDQYYKEYQELFVEMVMELLRYKWSFDANSDQSFAIDSIKSPVMQRYGYSTASENYRKSQQISLISHRFWRIMCGFKNLPAFHEKTINYKRSSRIKGLKCELLSAEEQAEQKSKIETERAALQKALQNGQFEQLCGTKLIDELLRYSLPETSNSINGRIAYRREPSFSNSGLSALFYVIFGASLPEALYYVYMRSAYAASKRGNPCDTA